MASERYQPLQGMSDLFAPEIHQWQTLEQTAREVLHRYQFTELRTPILEYEEVFLHSLGSTTDIVQKEMFAFEDRGGRRVALRPEGTAGVMRFLSSLGPDAQTARVFYMGPMFRSERPQAGRKRQFHQIGVESMGAPDPRLDAECILLQLDLLAAWGLDDAALQLNTRGSKARHAEIAGQYREALSERIDELCDDCKRRIHTNVLRVLDCKQSECRAIVESLPGVPDLVSTEDRAYFDAVCACLDRVSAKYTVQPRMVRGLDYYEHTVWEVTHPALGAQDALAGGGRYAVQMGGTGLSGVGFAAGMERTLMALEGRLSTSGPACDLWLVSLGEAALDFNFALCRELRVAGLHCGMSMVARSMKAQMRAANRVGARFALILGESELESGQGQLKNMEDGSQQDIPLEAAAQAVGRIVRA